MSSLAEVAGVVASDPEFMTPCEELCAVLRGALARGRVFAKMLHGVPRAVECVELRVGDGEAYRIRVMETRRGDLRVELEIDGVIARGRLDWV